MIQKVPCQIERKDYDFYGDTKACYKSFKEVERKYYKYIEVPWTQPVLSSNGTLGGKVCAAYSSRTVYGDRYAYKAFDGNTTTIWTVTTLPVNLIFYSPEPIKVTNIQCRNRADGYNYTITAGKIQASNNNSTWDSLTSWTNSNASQGAVWTIELSKNVNYYNYYNILVSSGTGNEASLAEVSFTATRKSIAEGSPFDYDFYEYATTYRAAIG